MASTTLSRWRNRSWIAPCIGVCRQDAITSSTSHFVDLVTPSMRHHPSWRHSLTSASAVRDLRLIVTRQRPRMIRRFFLTKTLPRTPVSNHQRAVRMTSPLISPGYTQHFRRHGSTKPLRRHPIVRTICSPTGVLELHP